VGGGGRGREGGGGGKLKFYKRTWLIGRRKKCNRERKNESKPFLN